HADVKQAVGAETQAAAGMVLCDAGDFPQATRGSAGIGQEVGGCLALDHDGCDLAVLENLVLEVVFMVITKPGMKSEAEQAVRTALTEDAAGDIQEQGFRNSVAGSGEQ